MFFLKKNIFISTTIWKLLILTGLLLGNTCLALNFPAPSNGNNIVGKMQTTQVQNSEDFSDIALRFDVGFFEVSEANPNINSDAPDENSPVVIPTQYILPEKLAPNLIVINLPEMRLYYMSKDGKTVYIYPVGIGKINWGTPTGEMTIVNKEKNPSWVIPKTILKYRADHGEILPGVIPPGPENPLGDYAMRLSSWDYLIHGTNLPAGVGRRSSAGCIRLYNPDIEQLFNMADIGTKVVIINEAYKAGWLDGKLYLEAHMPLYEQRLQSATGEMSAVIDAIDKATNKNPKIIVDWNRAFKVARDHMCAPRVVSKN
jgi:L,D-transpeptidase ErfK/SrfK